MTNMKPAAPPAGEGLPNLNAGGSILIETEHGLSVCRPLKSLKSSILSAESLDEFMRLLDRYVAFGDREDFVRHHWAKGVSYHEHLFRATAVEAAADQKSARRALTGHLSIIRQTPAKDLDDILFKAELVAVLESYEVKNHRTVAHSIVNDLLSAGCTWMQPSANERLSDLR
jgi:hypothetical protein